MNEKRIHSKYQHNPNIDIINLETSVRRADKFKYYLRYCPKCGRLNKTTCKQTSRTHSGICFLCNKKANVNGYYLPASFSVQLENGTWMTYEEYKKKMSISNGETIKG